MVNEWHSKRASETSSKFRMCWAIWLKFVSARGLDIFYSKFTSHRTLFAGLWRAMPLLSAVSPGFAMICDFKSQSSSQPKKSHWYKYTTSKPIIIYLARDFFWWRPLAISALSSLMLNNAMFFCFSSSIHPGHVGMVPPLLKHGAPWWFFGSWF